jgi:hypothetical protein
MKSIISKIDLVLIAAIACSIALSRPAAADVILDQPAPSNGPGLASAAGFAVGYDDFKLPQADTVTSVQWVGLPVSPDTTFTVSFTTDSSPGSSLPNTTPFVTETVTPTSVAYGPFFDEFTATLVNSVALPASTDLWISIYDPNGFWDWVSATAAPDPGALSPGLSVGDVGGSLNLNAIDLSFTLLGGPTPASVPEPSSSALFATALTALIAHGLMRRRKRT